MNAVRMLNFPFSTNAAERVLSDTSLSLALVNKYSKRLG